VLTTIDLNVRVEVNIHIPQNLQVICAFIYYISDVYNILLNLCCFKHLPGKVFSRGKHDTNTIIIHNF